MHRDIEKRKRIEEALRVSEDRYRLIYESAPDAITISRSVDGQFLEVNNAFCRLTGYTRDEIIGSTSVELKLFDNPQARKQFIQYLKKKGAISGLEVKYINRDGKTSDALLAGKILNYDDEDCVMAVVTDITRQKEAEAALKESEEKYRLLAENANDAIFIIQDGQIKFPNPKAALLGDYLSEKADVAQFFDHIHEDERKGLFAIFALRNQFCQRLVKVAGIVKIR